jgi:HlyD family secretion protein
MKRRTIFILVIVIVVAVAGFFIYRSVQKARLASQNLYQTIALQRGDLTAIVGATGTVHANQSTTVGWQTSGQIDILFVNLDDSVKAGQTLAQLKESSLSQSIILARADLITAERSLENLKISDVARTSAYQAMVTAQKALDDARTKRESKQYARASSDTLDIARANLIIAEDGVTKAEQLYDQVDSLPEDNPIRATAYSQLATARQTRDRALANLNWLLARPDEQELSEVDANVQVAEANLKDATREWERLKNGPDPKDIEAAEARVSALQATLDLAYLKAPFAGTITEVNSMEGDQVNPGTITYRIDDLSHLLVDIDIPEVDINRIQVGQPAKLTFDAIQDREYSGLVKEVARIGTPGQGAVNFKVTVELTDIDGGVRPGMTAAVNIIVNQVNEVLLIPNRAVRLQEGKRIIYILRENVPTPVEIEIGASSDIESVLIAGELQEGDLVVLNPPTSFGPPGGGMFGQ